MRDQVAELSRLAASVTQEQCDEWNVQLCQIVSRDSRGTPVMSITFLFQLVVRLWPIISEWVSTGRLTPALVQSLLQAVFETWFPRASQQPSPFSLPPS
jgi:hypothetical protein